MNGWSLVFFAIFFIPYYLNARITTVPEFLERRFDRRSRLYLLGSTLFSNIVVDTAGTLFAGAMVLKVFFPDLHFFTACLGLALVADRTLRRVVSLRQFKPQRCDSGAARRLENRS